MKTKEIQIKKLMKNRENVEKILSYWNLFYIIKII